MSTPVKAWRQVKVKPFEGKLVNNQGPTPGGNGVRVSYTASDGTKFWCLLHDELLEESP
jgi:hypothetical protein